VVDSAATFYHPGIGYQGGTVRTAAIEIQRREMDTFGPTAPEGSVIVLSTAELAECTCPEWCERDHDRD
jgi:hypothetical protein